MTRSGHPRRWILAVVLIVLGLPAVALAQSELLGGKFRTGDEVVIPAGEEVAGDLYASAGSVRIEGTVQGDLVATGGQVTVSSGGEVGEDLVFGTGSTTLAGRVVGDVLGSTGSYDRTGDIGGTEDVRINQGRAREEPTAADRVLDG